MNGGFLRLDRRFFSGCLWKEARTYSMAEAWLYLIEKARFDGIDEAACVRIGGREVSYTRGQYPASIRFLSKAWRWAEKAVRNFLSLLKRWKYVAVECSQGINVITVLDPYEEAGKKEDKTMKHTEKEVDFVPAGGLDSCNCNKGQERAQIRRYNNPQEKENTPKGVQKKEAPAEGMPESAQTLPGPLAERASQLWSEMEAARDKHPGRYSDRMMKRFFDYWTEPDKARGTAQKMLFEKQKTWQTSRRMATWEERDREWAGRTEIPQGVILKDNRQGKYDDDKMDW